MIYLSVVVPIRNEAEHIAGVLDRLLAQQYDSDKLEIIVVDGLSTDATPQIVKEYEQKHPQIRYLENPKKLSCAARNIGIKNAKGEAVIIVDGHCTIDSDDMLRHVDEAFAKSGADCLGRPQPLEMEDATALQWAIATARRSPLGHHPDSFIYSGEAQLSPALSVAIAYRKSVFEKVGYFDESFDACEDVEMNTRIDAAGLKCYFDPAIAVRYAPRKTLNDLMYQMSRYGRGRVRLWRKHRETFSWKSFAPGVFAFGIYCMIFYCLASLLIAAPIIHLTGQIYVDEYIRFPMPFMGGLLALYALIIFAESVRLSIRQKRRDILSRLPFVFLRIHSGYGAGIVSEFFVPKRRTETPKEREV
jgi:succinoglycan biosynthesis protein ExoA